MIYSWFWPQSTATYLWNHVADLLIERGVAIPCWEAKYHYLFWRPVTVIPLGDTDGKPATIADPSWMCLFATPAHPEYPSGHSTVSGAAAMVLASFLGEKRHFTMDNDLLIGVTRSFRSFSQALDEVKNARIFAGIHFRSACDDGQTTSSKMNLSPSAQPRMPDAVGRQLWHSQSGRA
jgi:hypothetical protein